MVVTAAAMEMTTAVITATVKVMTETMAKAMMGLRITAMKK